MLEGSWNKYVRVEWIKPGGLGNRCECCKCCAQQTGMYMHKLEAIVLFPVVSMDNE